MIPTDNQPLDSYQNAERTDYDQVDAAEKIREKKMVNFFGTLLDRDLLVSKAFYFFTYSAFGSLFPLIAVYFKQLGMNATQAGILIGIRPFVEFASAPFWGQFADKFRKGKFLLLFSIVCWIAFTLSIKFVQPDARYCLHKNESGYLYLGRVVNTRTRRSISYIPTEHARFKRQEESIQESEESQEDIPKPGYEEHKAGIAPDIIDPDRVSNYDPADGDLLSPHNSPRVYKGADVQGVFILVLLLICLGEFFSSPAVSLADACTLSYLEDTPELYGKQRLFGSIGWGIAMFIVGIALDYSTAFPNHPCGSLEHNEKNYTLCFAAFCVLMLAALIVATQFTFVHDLESQRPDEVAQMIMDSQIARVDATIAEQAKATAPEVTEEVPASSYIGVLKAFKAPPYVAFFVVMWWFGFGVGLVFSFLFWHLQDIGGSPSLFGIASVINHLSEIGAYFFSYNLINKIGPVKVLYVGLIANICRFLYVSILSDAYWVLPFEFVQGLTHAAVWAAATSYISLSAPVTQKTAAQGLLSALHNGLGKGCGAIIGGIIVTYTGTSLMFCGYALITLVILGLYYVINRRFNADSVTVTGSYMQDGSAALAPHGIPMNVPGSEQLTDKFSAPPPGLYGATQPAPDPTQDAYDRYITQPSYEKQPVRFDNLPSNFGGR